MQADRPATKPCILCASDIPLAARYCTHCESYQNWRRHIQFGNVTLTLLVALVAVIGGLAGPMGALLNRPNSNLLGSGLIVEAGSITLTISNLGDRQGIIDDITFTMSPQDAEVREPQAETPGNNVSLSERLSQALQYNTIFSNWALSSGPDFLPPDNPVATAGEVRKVNFKVATPPAYVENPPPELVDRFLEATCSVTLFSTAFDTRQSSQVYPVDCGSTLASLFPESAEAIFEGRLRRISIQYTVLDNLLNASPDPMSTAPEADEPAPPAAP